MKSDTEILLRPAPLPTGVLEWLAQAGRQQQLRGRTVLVPGSLNEHAFRAIAVGRDREDSGAMRVLASTCGAALFWAALVTLDFVAK